MRNGLQRLFGQQALFEPSDRELSLITCRKAPGEFTLCIANNSWRERPLAILSRCGPVVSIRELPLDASEKSAPGYLPESVSADLLGRSSETTIAGGDVRVFAVTVNEASVEEIAHVVPPARPKGKFLSLRRLHSIKEEILSRPTFFEHFDGVVVDWRHVADREKTALQRESGWIRRQGLQVSVDLSSGVNLYPGLRLIDNIAEDYGASMGTITSVIDKMECLGSRDLIFSLHRYPENNFTGEQTRAAFEKTLKELATHAAAHQVTLHLRIAAGKPPWNIPDALRILDAVGAPNLRLAPSTALLSESPESSGLAQKLSPRLGLWLVSARRHDVGGKSWDAHAPIHGAPATDIVSRWVALSPNIPVVLDAICAGSDEEYLEAAAIDRLRVHRANQR